LPNYSPYNQNVAGDVKRRIIYGSGLVVLAVLVVLVVWQGSFSLEPYSPESASQTVLLWAVSTLIFILMVTLGFMLVRTFVKLYVERRSNREGSRIRTKLVIGALALSIMPVFFLVTWSINILNNNIARWFSRPAASTINSLVEINLSFENETQQRAQAQARWLALLPETRQYLAHGVRPFLFNPSFCAQHGIFEAAIEPDQGAPLVLCRDDKSQPGPRKVMAAHTPLEGAKLTVRAQMGVDLAARREQIEGEVRKFQQIESHRKDLRDVYIRLLVLITLFILFVATWIALLMAKQISVPISALLEAAGQLRRGNLDYRIQTRATDELATLVRGFNEMATELQANEKEIERRRNFIEAILESIPTGVISLSAERRIQRVNPALVQMLGAEKVAASMRLEDLFLVDDAREIHYLLNRARRTGLASSQLDLKQGRQMLHLAVTVSALVGRHTSGWVIVLEDTSELLRAQRAAAWHEVARRIAHEMKNPLTPIALSAERIARQMDKAEAAPATPEMMRILRQCSATISSEVESVKTLVDEFSQFSRFPAAQPVSSDLNEVVENAAAVFAGRLDGIEVLKSLSEGLPAVSIDRDQFKRVIVNLVDNAAEAMQDSTVRRLAISTQIAGADTVELTVADTGPGISPEDRERLFLPYFSTKGRGTGLGLAIVHHILQEHGARIRVEDNLPTGARFVVEIPVLQQPEIETRPDESYSVETSA